MIVAPRMGAWIETSNTRRNGILLAVAPRMGAWIETIENNEWKLFDMSRPAWARGLKLHLIEATHKIAKVAPRMGAWIETHLVPEMKHEHNVAPRMGAWIETR